MTTTPIFSSLVEQEIWTTIRAMNDAWTKGDPDDLKQFFHPRMIAVTATDRHRLDGGPACIAAWKRFAQTTQIHFWKEVDPVIRVFGDAAVVAYDFDMSFEMGGQTITMGGRDLFFVVRENGRWWVVGDQFSPYPA
ncbi:MAG: nuclear transport factor 2 family protein [Betaproteobacteria bacterium]|nr:nuclear transport factor 2 family protein [Betaproteobacteria bacterium]